MTWGPFVPGIDPAEVKTRLRCLRLAVKLIAGPRGLTCRHALLMAEIDLDEDSLAHAADEFGRLGTIDQRRVLSVMAGDAVEVAGARKVER